MGGAAPSWSASPDGGWQIEEGILTVLESGGGESRARGDIVAVKRCGDFELELDFRYTPGADSGIKYFVDPDLNTGTGSAIGCGFQILDDRKHPDAKKGVKGNRVSFRSLKIRSVGPKRPRARPWPGPDDVREGATTS